MSLSSVSGQESTTIDNPTLTQYVKICEKCEADLKDTQSIVKEQVLIIETQEAYVEDLQNSIDLLQGAVASIKVAYNDVVSSNQKNKFWVWIKGVLTGTVLGTVITIIVLI